VFGLGALLHDLLLGRPPWSATTVGEVALEMDHRGDVDLAEHRGGLGRSLTAVLEKALSASPERRYASMSEFGSDLRAVREHRPVAARSRSSLERLVVVARRRPARTAAILALVLAVIVGTFAWLQNLTVASERRER